MTAEKEPAGTTYQKLPPGYTLGTRDRQCGNCEYFDGGWCNMGYGPVSAAKVCNDWVAEKK